MPWPRAFKRAPAEGAFLFSPKKTMGTAWTRSRRRRSGSKVSAAKPAEAHHFGQKKIGPGAAKTDKKERTTNTKHRTPNTKWTANAALRRSRRGGPDLQSGAKLKPLGQFPSKRADPGFRPCIRRSSDNGRPACPCNSRRSDRNTPRHPIALANPRSESIRFRSHRQRRARSPRRTCIRSFPSLSL